MDQLQFSDQPKEIAMECFICGAAAQRRALKSGGHSIDCPECGLYQAQGDFSKAYQVVATGMRDILDLQRQQGIALPVISGQSALTLCLLRRVSVNGEPLVKF
jgi:hypothetical protein